VSRMRENLTSGSTGGSWKRNTLTTGTQKNDPAGNRKVNRPGSRRGS